MTTWPRTAPPGRLAMSVFLASQIAVPPCAFAQQSDTVYAAVADSVFALSVAGDNGREVGTASGFVVEPDLLLTNAHVANAGHISVQIGSRLVACEVERIDRAHDLALCRMQARAPAKPLKLAADDPKPGSTIYAIGNPQGFNKTISEGLFTRYRDLEGRRVAEISAAISPGSSGGPIVNVAGDVVGVAEGSFAHGENLNFAVPRDVVREFIASSQPSPDVHQGVVGVLVGAAAAGFSIFFGGLKAHR
jgi:S1-C subfamily serine protease